MKKNYNKEEKTYGKDLQELYLSSMITDNELFIICQNILKSSYFDDSLKNTVTFLLDYVDEYSDIPAPSVIKAKTGIALAKLDDYDEGDREFLIHEIEGFCKHQALIEAIIKSTELMDGDQTGDIEGVIKDALLVGINKEIGTDYFEDPKARLLKLKEDIGTLKTGWPSVDKKLFNVGRGELLLFAAGSGAGKSMILQNLAVNFSIQNLNVVYITLELSEELCCKRMDSMFSGVACSDVFKNLDSVDIAIKKLGMRYGNITVKRFSANSTNTIDLKSYLKEYEIQRGYKPDILAVDYLDLMAPNNKKISPSDLFIKDKFVSEELRNLAIEQDLLLVTASQFNRGAVDAIDFDHSHIAGGKSKIDTADNVIGIRSDTTLRERGVIMLNYLKTRNGGGFGSHTELALDIETLRVSEPNEDYEGDYNAPSNQVKAKTLLNDLARKNGAPTETKKKVESPPISQSDRLKGLIEKVRKD